MIKVDSPPYAKVSGASKSKKACITKVESQK